MVDTIATLNVDLTMNTSQVTRGLGQVEGQLRGAQSGFGTIGSQIGQGISQGIGFGIGLGVVGITAQLTRLGASVIGVAMDWEDAWTGVLKVVDGTSEELAALESQLLGLSVSDSPVAGLENAAVQLAGIAEMAGQLGVAREDIVSFTEVIAMLSMTTNLAGEEGAAMLAQFANITNMDMGNIERLGSAIVALGNDGASTEQQIVEFAHRLAGAGAQAGMTEAEILALGSAMASAGLNAEAGGTAMTTVLNKLAMAAARGGTALDTFARVSDTTAENFADTWRNEPTQALIMFMDGLNDLDQASQLEVLEELELDGIRVSDTLRRLSGNVGLVEDALDTANTAWDENTALMTEAEKRAETTSAQWNLLKNKISAVGIAIGGELLPAVNSAIDGLGGLLEIGADLIGINLGFDVQGEAPDLQAEANRIIGPMPAPIDVSVPTTIEYVIQPGDNPSSIAAAHGLSLQELFDANPGLVDAQFIYANDVLQIPVATEIEFQVSTETTGGLERLNQAMYKTAEASQQIEPSGMDKLNDAISEATGMQADFGGVGNAFEKIADWAVPDGVVEFFEDVGDAISDMNFSGFMETGDIGQLINGDAWSEATLMIPMLFQAMTGKIEVAFLDIQISAIETVNSIIDTFNGLGAGTLNKFGIDIEIDEIDTSELEAKKQEIIDEKLTATVDVVVEDAGIDNLLAAFNGEPMTIAVNATGLDELATNLEAITIATGEPLTFTVGEDSYTSVNAFNAALMAGTYDSVTEPMVVTISEGTFQQTAWLGEQIDHATRDRTTSDTITSNAAEVGAAIDQAARDRFSQITFRISEIGASIVNSIPGFAAGGRPPVGEVSIVGENGPELFVPDTAGQIIPNHDLVGMSGGSSGGGMVINIDSVHVSGVNNAAEIYEQIVDIARTKAQPGFVMEGY